MEKRINKKLSFACYTSTASWEDDIKAKIMSEVIMNATEDRIKKELFISEEE